VPVAKALELPLPPVLLALVPVVVFGAGEAAVGLEIVEVALVLTEPPMAVIS